MCIGCGCVCQREQIVWQFDSSEANATQFLAEIAASAHLVHLRLQLFFSYGFWLIVLKHSLKMKNAGNSLILTKFHKITLNLKRITNLKTYKKKFELKLFAHVYWQFRYKSVQICRMKWIVRKTWYGFFICWQHFFCHNIKSLNCTTHIFHSSLIEFINQIENGALSRN